MAVGICFARPFHLNYSFDFVQDPAQTSFVADTNLTESFNRFRAAFAKDFRFSAPGESSWFTHVSLGAAVDVGYAHWSFRSDDAVLEDDVTAPGGGGGLLLGVYDNTEDLKINLGVAYQSGIYWKFSNDPRLYPAFDMPQQINVGITGYFLPGLPLRATVDFQWVNWAASVDPPSFPNRPAFRDALNYSAGLEYRIPLADNLALYPRAGYRLFNAPWPGSGGNLPFTDTYKLLVSTGGGTFHLATFGAGLSWTADGKIRSVDIAGDVGGDAFNLAFGFNNEF
jgi:hypothetical protein